MKKIVMFSAQWCGPCRMSKPIFNQLKESRSDLHFEIIDIDENRDMAEDFNITSVPTFMIIEDNEEVSRFVGGAELNKLKEVL